MCNIAAGQHLYYHVSPLPLGIRCYLHIYFIFVYSCSVCILSPKLARVIIFCVGGWLCFGSSSNRFPESLSLSARIQFKGSEITSFFSLTFVQNLVQSQNTKPQMFFKKSLDNGCKFFIWNTNSFYLFNWKRMGMTVRIYLSSCSLAIRRALSPHALEAHSIWNHSTPQVQIMSI